MPERPVGAPLTNPRSERVKRVAALAGRSARERTGLILAEGPQSVREAIRYGEVRDLYLTADAAARHPDIVREATRLVPYRHEASGAVLEAMSRDCQGMLAVVSWVPTTWDEARAAIDASPRAASGIVAVLQEVRDPGNLGTVIRAADAAGADAVVLTGDCVDPANPKVVRASAGSLFHLPIVVEPEVVTALDLMGRDGYRRLATTAGAADEVFATGALRPPVALVFGNEARGLPDDIVAACDGAVAIPIFGRAESLNLAMAATVSLYAAALAAR